MSGLAVAADIPVKPCKLKDPETAHTIQITSGFGWPHNGPNNTGVFSELMTEAFCRLGLKANIAQLPAARSIVQANAGAFFGEGPRRWSLAGQYKNLLLTQPYLYELKFSAFSTRPLKVSSYNDLAAYHVGTVLGRKSVERNLTAVLEDFITATNAQVIFNALKENRIDIVVLDEPSGHYFAHKAGINKLYIAELERHPFHLLVNKKYRKDIPKIEAALRDLSKEGFAKKLFEKNTLKDKPADHRLQLAK